MTARRFFASAVLCTFLTAAAIAQVTGRTIQERKNDQQGRIAQGVRSAARPVGDGEPGAA
jgi:hypothetical protein